MQHPAACLAAFLMLYGASVASATAQGLAVEDAWIRATPGADVAAAYLTLHNQSNQPLTVVGVRSPLAAHAMIHESRLVNGQSTMRPLERLRIGPADTVRFAPGGLHVMLQELAHSLTPGEQVPLVLLLDGGGTLKLTARVRALGGE